MKLGHVIIYVKDVVKSVEFYEKAFGLKRSFIDPTSMYAQMETGNTALGFAKDELATSNINLEYHKNHIDDRPSGFEVSFAVPNVKAAYEKALANGCIKVADPEEKPWGQEVAFVRDLNGILVEMASEMEK
ncbi:glyoxalase [Candidatus Aerophobetes bacterium]|uniref:Glyoxalase n=1 Tax=Aerophobetes bacterium TaxID=2030807 RepID=A0A2A4YLP3_UNCAE|nr:MAG: glyoxalase [Candidatus Aerophobetes bacterium]